MMTAMSSKACAILACVWFACCGCCLAAGAAAYNSRDTLRLNTDDDPKAAQMLRQVVWEPAEFQVRTEPNDPDWSDAPRLVRFPSPRPDAQGGPAVNSVVLAWYPAQGLAPDARAPAVLLLHTIDPRLFLSRGIARGLAQRGIHAFVMHSPGYGLRQYREFRSLGDRFFDRAAQCIADARRARDAVAALPGVDTANINIQGTSLGGFYATGAAALDGAFRHHFFMLAGADIHGVLTHGWREAQWVRESLARQGIEGDKLRELCEKIEPAYYAHRIDPTRTWLFSGIADQVVHPQNARALARIIGLDESHHLWLQGDHYLSLLNIPWCVQKMAQEIRDKD